MTTAAATMTESVSAIPLNLLHGQAAEGQYEEVCQLSLEEVRDMLGGISGSAGRAFCQILTLFEEGNSWVWTHLGYVIIWTDGDMSEAVLLRKYLSAACLGQGCHWQHDHPHEWLLVRMPRPQDVPARLNSSASRALTNEFVVP